MQNAVHAVHSMHVCQARRLTAVCNSLDTGTEVLTYASHTAKMLVHKWLELSIAVLGQSVELPGQIAPLLLSHLYISNVFMLVLLVFFLNCVSQSPRFITFVGAGSQCVWSWSCTTAAC